MEPSFSPKGTISHNKLNELIQLAYSLGVSGATIISSPDIPIKDELANFCKPPNCGNYGLSPYCPPYNSGPAGFRELQKNFRYALVVRIDIPSATLFSNEYREVMKWLHEVVATIEQAALRIGFSQARAFAAGACKDLFCHNYPDCPILLKSGECRFPEYARPSMSGFGINVAELMKACGWSVNINVQKSELDSESMSWVAGLILIS